MNENHEEKDNDIFEETTEVETIIQLEKRELNIKQYDRMIEDIISHVDSNKIFLTPDYQRKYVWDNSKASLFIESLLMNVPIPPIYAAEEGDIWNIVDGLQRIKSLHRFYKDEFKLGNLEVLTEYIGFKYSQLPEKAKKVLDRGELRIILILETSSPEIQYDVFERLNRGSVVLNEQELRNCLYRGTLNNLLRNKLINYDKFQKILRISENHKRMSDVEVVLRFLAMYYTFDFEQREMRNYDGRIKNLLNSFMRKNANPLQDELDQMENLFYETIDKVYAIFGENAFRKIDEALDYVNKLNKPLMDAVMLSFTQFSFDDLMSKKDEIILMNKALLIDEEFIQTISTATGNTTKTEYRINRYLDELTERF